MDINKLIENYKSYEELKIFVEIQFKQLQALTKKNKELQAKLDSKPSEIIDTGNSAVIATLSGDDAKMICEIQLNILRKASMERELNTDEAKRVELYNRILKEGKSKDKNNEDVVDKAPTAELLKLVE